jgi:hypothetical protein
MRTGGAPPATPDGRTTVERTKLRHRDSQAGPHASDIRHRWVARMLIRRGPSSRQFTYFRKYKLYNFHFYY